MRSFASLAPLAAFVLVAACGNEAPAPKSEPSSKPVTTASSTVSASPVASASAVAPPPMSAAPSAPAPSASAAPSAPLVPSEKPSVVPPGEGEFAAAPEIAVKASSEQKCTTKVLTGWFEMACGPAEGLVRARKVDIESGFDKESVVMETDEDGKLMRFVAALPASGELSRARFWGKGLHEIFLTLENTDKGWKGQLTGKRPSP